MIDYQPMSPEALFTKLHKALHGLKEQHIPSLRIAHDVERRESALHYSGGPIFLSTQDGSPVHPGIRHIAHFWLKMLKLPSSPASIEKLHARPVPSEKPHLTMSPAYLLITAKTIGRRPCFDWPEDQGVTARLKAAFEDDGGEAVARPEVTLDYEEGLRDRRGDLELILENAAWHWSYFCEFAAPWFVDSGVTNLEMSVPIFEPDHPHLTGRAE